MAGKGRPITNFSNYWHVSGMQILEAAAVRVLSEYDPWRDGMVAVGDLVSEGWRRSFRYANDDTLKYQFLHAVRHMTAMYAKLRWESSGAKYRVTLSPLPDKPDSEPYICPYSRVGFMAVDMVDELKAIEPQCED